MINIKVNFDGKGTKTECEVHIEGRKAAVCEFYSVLKSLEKCDEDFLCDAFEMLIKDKIEGSDDDESEG